MVASVLAGRTRARRGALLRSLTATGLAGATAAGGLVAAPAAAAEAAPLEVTLDASSRSLKSVGDYLALDATVLDPSGAPVPGVDVTWYRKPLAGGGWEALKTSTTDADGRSSYGTAPDQGYAYDVITAATDEYASGSPTSVAVELDVQKDLRSSVSSSATTVRPGQTVVLEARTRDEAGNPVGVPITWYRQAVAGGGWQEVTRSGTDGAGRSTLGATVDQAYRYDFISAETARYSSTSPTSTTVDVQQKSRAQQLLDYAYQFAGTPYRWGGTTPGGFDCSGFTGYVFRHMGVNLPRTSRDQRATVVNIPKGQQQPGDLIFTHDSSGRVYHVTIYEGNGRTFGATRSGDVVRHSNIWSSNYSVGRAI